MPERLEVQRAVAASAGEIFAVLTDPRGHVAIDSSGLWMRALVNELPSFLTRPRGAAMSMGEDGSSEASGRALQQAPGPVKHSHPGEETIYIVEGSLE